MELYHGNKLNPHLRNFPVVLRGLVVKKKSRKYLLSKRIVKRNVILTMIVKMELEINNMMIKIIVKNLKNYSFMDLAQKWLDLIPKKEKNQTKLGV